MKKIPEKIVPVFLILGTLTVVLILTYFVWSLRHTAPLPELGETGDVVTQDTLAVVEDALPSAPLRTEETPVIVQDTQLVQKGAIQYNTSTQSVLKTIVLPEDAGNLSTTIYLNDIGTILSGKFKDNKLGFAFRTLTDLEQGALDDQYAYFIIDHAGGLVAWDKNFIHADRECFNDANTKCPYDVFYEVFDLQHTAEQSLGFLPREFSIEKNILDDDHQSKFSKSEYISNNDFSGMQPFEGLTESGFQIFNDREYGKLPVSSITIYWVQLPFGKMIQIAPEPDFFDELSYGPPRITWTQGTKAVASYNYGQYAYGWDDCYDNISETEFNVGLIVTGTTVKGDPLYEIDAQKFPNVYGCLHEKTKRYVYNEKTDTGIYEDTIAYKDFIYTHPMFFWRHPVVGLMGMVRSDVIPAAEKAKPVVYLYPKKEERVHVVVNPIGGLTITDPAYGSGWAVDATPEGKLTNVVDGKEYPYLFWEGGKEGVVQTPQEGFVVAKNAVRATLDEKLSAFGLNTQERADFLQFWVPKLSHAPYYFITFISRAEIDRVAPMHISPTPDTVIRLLMDYKPLTEYAHVEPLKIQHTKREGFTAVEWGGIVRD